MLPIYNQIIEKTSDTIVSLPLISETFPQGSVENLSEMPKSEDSVVDSENLNSQISSIVTQSVNSAVERIEKELVNNLSKFSEEIAQLRSELSETVKNFNEAIKSLNELAVELRTSMSDMNNPFFV
ncbi:MAG: hypothetical protein QW134_05495, partial [Nitrososphaeria archaeon]